MKLSSLLIPVLAAAPFIFQAAPARADTPCGKFDFTSGISCKIEVSGGCKADCTSLKFEAGCTGGCVGTAAMGCTSSCGAQCVAQCDPAHLDCFTGCHTECDQPTKDQCMMMHPTADCVEQSTVQCDIHCKEACMVKPLDCSEQCGACCHGSCTTQANFMCDFDCFAKLQGGCDVQCADPKGALFCNGQYVGATDIEQCISYLSTQGIKVDVSARGKVECGLSGCTGSGSATGCTAAPMPGSDVGAGTFGLAVVGLAIAAERRRRRRS